MNSFSVSECVYDGTSGDPNPLCAITGTVNGFRVFPQVFFRYLTAANEAGGIGMQSALTAILFNWYASVYRNLLEPWPDKLSFPVFPPSNAVAQHTEGSYPVALVSYAPALIGSWQA